MLGTHLFFLWSVRGRVLKADPDFTVYYTAAKILGEGRGSALYDPATQETVQREFATNSDIRRGPLPYIHPPYEAVVFLPLTLLPYHQAFLLWNALNFGLLVAIAVLLRRSLVSLQAIPLWEWTLALLAFFPVFANFLQGQDAILLLLVFVLGFRALDRDADFLAGCWLGLGLFKYHFVVPLVVILIVWRGRKLAAGFAATASSVVLLSLAVVGWREALDYPAYAWRVVSLPGHGQTPIGLMPNLMGLVAGWPSLQDLGWTVRLVVLAASVALLIAVASMRDLASDRRFFRLSFACAVITAVLVGYNTNAHDLCLLVLPLALLADHCVTHWHVWRQSDLRPARSLLMPVLPLLVSPLWIFLWMRWGRLNLMTILLLWWIYAMRQEVINDRGH